jgi:hypothetical protein
MNKAAIKQLYIHILTFLYFYFLNSFIHMCIHCLGHFSPLPPPPSSSPHHLSLPGRICSALISNYVEKESIRNNKKDKVFLLVEIRIAIQLDS